MRRYVVFFFLLLVVSTAQADSITLVRSTSTVLPGQSLRLEINGVSPTVKSKALFMGKSYPFFAVGPNAQRAMVGVPLAAVPGTYPLKVQYGVETTTGPEADPWEIVVATRTFEIENVNFKPAQNALTTSEHNESARIHKAAKRITRDQLWEGAFMAPVEGPTIGKFGLKRMRNGKIHAGFHKGVDLRAAQGTPLHATNGGIVEMSATLRAHGKTILINHGQGVMSIYLHMSSLLVKPGEHVTKGQVIGKVGSTGLSTAPHVHWQIYIHAVPVDPQQWIDNEF